MNIHISQGCHPMPHTNKHLQVVMIEIRSKPDGPGIDGGSGAYVHIFFQSEDANWQSVVNDFIEYYGYEMVSIEEEPRPYKDSDDWSEYNRKQATDSNITGFPRFGTFHVFD